MRVFLAGATGVIGRPLVERLLAGGHEVIGTTRHEERAAVEVFLKSLRLATETFLNDPLGVPMISNWSRVAAAVPDIFAQLREAVEQDHAWNPANGSEQVQA